MLAARDLWLAPPGAPDPVVRGVSFQVAPGEWVAVTGPNGSGKTCLALAVAGLLAPRRGDVTWCGRPTLRREPAGEGGAVVAVLQDPSSQLLEGSVAAELALTARNLGLGERDVRDSVERWADAFGLAADGSRDPRALSGGRQQLALLAAALVARPGLLVADEATAHLDASARAAVLDAIGRERRRGLAVLWVTQDPAECALADRVLTLGEAPALPRGLPTAVSVPAAAPRAILRITPGGALAGPRVDVLETLAIPIPEAGTLGVTGPNGSGKSVLLQAIAGLVPCPQVSIEARDRGDPPPILVTQHPELLVFQDRAADELLFAAVSRGRSRRDALAEGESLLERLGLPPADLLRRSTWDLSTGEKRLLEVVAALVAPAGIVALDEPTAGVDPGRRLALLDMVRERARVSAVIVASQDEDWILGLGGEKAAIGQAFVKNAKSQQKNRLTAP